MALRHQCSWLETRGCGRPGARCAKHLAIGSNDEAQALRDLGFLQRLDGVADIGVEA